MAWYTRIDKNGCSYIALMVSPVLCPIRASTVRKTMLKRKSVVSLVVACTQISCIQLGVNRNITTYYIPVIPSLIYL